MQHHVASLAAPEIDREVGRDPIEPGREAGSRLELREVFIGANESFLRQFNRVILIVHHRQRDSDYAALVSLHQNAECRRIALAGAFDKFGFITVLATGCSQLE